MQLPCRLICRPELISSAAPWISCRQTKRETAGATLVFSWISVPPVCADYRPQPDLPGIRVGVIGISLGDQVCTVINYGAGRFLIDGNKRDEESRIFMCCGFKFRNASSWEKQFSAFRIIESIHQLFIMDMQYATLRAMRDIPVLPTLGRHTTFASFLNPTLQPAGR